VRTIAASAGEDWTGVDRAMVRDLLQVPRPAVYFANLIGDSMLTLPTLRALGQLFTAPLTFICPKVAFELCFHEVSPHYVDITGIPPKGLPPIGPGLGLPPHRELDFDALAAEIGTVDVFINTIPWNMPSNAFIEPLRQLVQPTTSIGFPTDDDYEIVIQRDIAHSADLIFKLARLFDPTARIEDYAQPLPAAPEVQARARAMRDAVPAGFKVLIVHADTDWTEKRWAITRFIDLLDRFLSRHPDFVAWVVGMGIEELNVGRHRDRVFPHLGLPLDLTVAMIATADLFVGIDSSMLHAADLARVPGVGMFGPTRPSMWGFRFAPHRHLDARSMADITVDEVLAEVEDLVGAHV
jgi:Glycosyltransferase family 9 (heptosyltransferase)